jgi:hypothetical protein
MLLKGATIAETMKAGRWKTGRMVMHHGERTLAEETAAKRVFLDAQE